MVLVKKFLSPYEFPVSPEEDVQKMVRVNLAGEESAVTIYEGQYKALKEDPIASTIEEMKAHEMEHRSAFLEWAKYTHTRPSLFGMIWKAAGFALGYVAGRLGPSYAMAQTQAVEMVIEEHYGQQVSAMTPGPFKDLLVKCQEEEIEHKHLGAQMREHSLALDVWMVLTCLGTKVAIKVAQRI